MFEREERITEAVNAAISRRTSYDRRAPIMGSKYESKNMYKGFESVHTKNTESHRVVLNKVISSKSLVKSILSPENFDVNELIKLFDYMSETLNENNNAFPIPMLTKLYAILHSLTKGKHLENNSANVIKKGSINLKDELIVPDIKNNKETKNKILETLEEINQFSKSELSKIKIDMWLYKENYLNTKDNVIEEYEKIIKELSEEKSKYSIEILNMKNTITNLEEKLSLYITGIELGKIDKIGRAHV